MSNRTQKTKAVARLSAPKPIDEAAMRAIDEEARAYRETLDPKIARMERVDQEDLRIRVR